MDFYTKKKYCYSDLEQLISNEIEENLHLDYKSAGALSKIDKKKDEITKDVSALANSDGGIIVYGINEKENKPDSFSYVDGNIFTKEWLENIINTIQPRITGIEIFPIRNEGKIEETVYVVKGPKSIDAPHMARSKKYYKRFNFCSEPMEDYEVKDLFYRHRAPQLELIGGALEKEELTSDSEEVVFSFYALIKNVGFTLSKDYKLSAAFFNLPPKTQCNYKPHEGINLGMPICKYCFRITTPSKETLFPGEVIQMGRYQIYVTKDCISDLDKAYIKITLRYEDCGKEEILVSANSQSDFIIYDKKKIEEYIQKDHPDFNLLDIL